LARTAGPEVQAIADVRPCHAERTARRMEDYPLASRLQPLHHHRSTGQSRMTAERHLGSGSEPTQAVIAGIGDQKRRFRQVVLATRTSTQAPAAISCEARCPRPPRRRPPSSSRALSIVTGKEGVSVRARRPWRRPCGSAPPAYARAQRRPRGPAGRLRSRALDDALAASRPAPPDRRARRRPRRPAANRRSKVRSPLPLAAWLIDHHVSRTIKRNSHLSKRFKTSRILHDLLKDYLIP
jgi:hypothetical protein